MDARVEDRIVVESERAAQSGRAGVIEEVLIRRASASGGTTGERASLPPRQGSRGSNRTRKSACRPDRRGGRAALARVHRQRRPLFVGRRPPRCYFPRDRFFCFFTFMLTIGVFAPVPRETGLGTGCFFDFPAMPILLGRGRVATDDRTLPAVGGCAVLSCWSCLSKKRSRVQKRRVGWLDWPCGQNTGRNPEGRQRASSARDDGASANRVHVAGPALLPEDRLRCWNSPRRL